jgi:hypothetical protein
MTNSSTHRTCTPQGFVGSGDFATMSINGDSYVVIIDKVTKSGKTITALHTVKQPDGTYIASTQRDSMVFRWNEKRKGFIYSQYFRLTLGEAVERRNPSF